MVVVVVLWGGVLSASLLSVWCVDARGERPPRRFVKQFSSIINWQRGVAGQPIFLISRLNMGCSFQFVAMRLLRPPDLI